MIVLNQHAKPHEKKVYINGIHKSSDSKSQHDNKETSWNCCLIQSSAPVIVMPYKCSSTVSQMYRTGTPQHTESDRNVAISAFNILQSVCCGVRILVEAK